MSTWDDKPNDYEHACAEIERLRAALEEVSNVQWQGATPETMLRLRLLAREALKDKP